jgi:Exopolysaccharide biosynthesis protein related to N-acetylglucosamine-1-phosphodiester alpha-N-acetylglucosaminidase
MRMTVALTVFLFLILAFAFPALAAPNHKAVFVVGQNIYTVDGQPREMDAAPFVENGRIFVPVRYLAYALGVAEDDIVWVGETGTVSLKLGGTLVQMNVGSKTLYVGGQPREMDVAPLVRDGRTYLPARRIAEAFGYEVGWNEPAKAVLIGPKGNLPAPPAPARVITHYSHGKATVVEIPPGAPVRPAVILARDQLGKTESLASMAERTGAIAAINGTYFNAYADKPGEPHGTPYGVIIKDGRVLQEGYRRAVVGVTADNRVKIAVCYGLVTESGGSIRQLVDENGEKQDWSDVVAAVQAGPRLVKNGETAVNFEIENFGEAKITSAVGARSAIGVKPDGSILLVTVPGRQFTGSLS